MPIVSWLARRGRCAYCRAELRAFYPAIELAALAVALSAAWLLSGWLLLASCGARLDAARLAVIDHRHFLLPDVLTLPLIPAGLAVAWRSTRPCCRTTSWARSRALRRSPLIGFAYRRLRGREGLGLGDAKLLAAAGAWLGWQALPGVVLIGGALRPCARLGPRPLPAVHCRRPRGSPSAAISRWRSGWSGCSGRVLVA